MASEQERAELDQRARRGETVVPGGTRGKSLEAQERLAEGNGVAVEGYREMGRKGGLSTADKSGGERAAEEEIPFDESKYKTGSSS